MPDKQGDNPPASGESEPKISVVKLVSGQEIVGRVTTAEANVLTISRPKSLQATPDPRNQRINVQLLPFSWGARAEEVDLNIHHVLCVLDATDELVRQYENVMSGPVE